VDSSNDIIIIIINVSLIHMYMIAGFQQEAAFGCQSISNLFRGAELLYPSVQANRTKPVSTRTPSLLRRILLARSVITAIVQIPSTHTAESFHASFS
jgi:hypothetical protein